MPAISLKTLLFYVVAALVLAKATLAAPTTLPLAESGSGATTEVTTTADSTTTTDGEAQAQATISSVPVFQCAANLGEAANVARVGALYDGLYYVSDNITEVSL